MKRLPAFLLLSLLLFLVLLPARSALAQPADGLTLVGSQQQPFPIDRYQLPNGLRIWHQPRPDSTSVTLLLMVDVGLRNETPATNGISHFTEHMLFAGSQRWNEQELKEVITNLGGKWNGFTSFEGTGYYAQVEPQHFATALEWLIELTLRPVLDGATVDKEREVLFAEGWGQKSRILEWLYAQGFGYDLNQALRRELFPGSPFSLTILGERDSLEAIDAAAIETYYKAHYRPDNMVLIVAGNVTPATLAEVVTDRWASVPAPTTPLPTVPAVQLAMQGPAHAVVRGPFPTDQVRLAYGFSTPGRLSPDHWALELLGEYLALRLKRQVRYDLGLVYALWPEIMTYTDAGYLAIRTDGPRRDRDQILALIQQELHTLVEEGVVDADFTLARNARLGQAALAMEDNMARAGYLAEWAAVLPPGAPAPDFRAKLAAVTADDLARVAATYNVPERQFLAEHQPAVSGADLAWLAGGALLLAGAGGGALWWRRRAKAGGVRPAPHDSL